MKGVLVALSVAGSVSAQDWTALEKTVLAELQETRTPGVALAIVSENRVVFGKGFGVASVETGEPVTADTLFRIGSTTKTATAAVLVGLAEEGRVSLEAPLGRAMPWLRPAFSQLTAHQLLSHTAGLKDVPADFGPPDPSALAGTIRTWTEDYALFEPGRGFSYSNPGYALAGLLIQEIAGKPYADVMEECLLGPLGMKRSTFRPTVAMTFPLAQGHEPGEDGAPHVVRPFSDDASQWPNGFLLTTANDLARFAIALLDNGRLDGRQVLAPATVSRMKTAHAEVLSPLPDLGRARYGYGLFLHEEGGLRALDHSGAMPGFSCSFRLWPEQKVAVLVLANRTAMFPRTSRAALETVLVRTVTSETALAPTEIPMDEAEMRRYVGKYRNRWTEEILVKEGKLYLRRGTTDWLVTKIGENRFLAKPPGARPAQELVLGAGAGGKVDALYLFLWGFKRVEGN